VRDSGTETIGQGISLLLVAPASLHDRADYSDELLAFHPPILLATQAGILWSRYAPGDHDRSP
jgi:hypothetical protein